MMAEQSSDIARDEAHRSATAPRRRLRRAELQKDIQRYIEACASIEDPTDFQMGFWTAMKYAGQLVELYSGSTEPRDWSVPERPVRSVEGETPR